MTFLQPLLLLGMPLIGLPILIHLINQRRFQTIRWGAMMFLLAAQRMSRGYSRLRQILILLVRTLAIAGLIFAISRPLSSGWLGSAAGGRADTTLILLDRSASMQQIGAGTAESKLKTGIRQLAQTLRLLGSSRWVLIDSVSNKPREIDSPDALLKLPDVEPTSASSDMAALLETAREYIAANKAGRTEVWICSDLRENDWNATSGRWQRLRDGFAALPQGVRFHLLAYPASDDGNVSLRVTEVRRVSGTHPELLVSLKLTRSGNSEGNLTVPVEFLIEDARSILRVDMNSKEYLVKDHHIPLAPQQERGWGVVSIPADLNPGDNTNYLVFDQPPVRQTLIVSEDENTGRILQLVASIPPEPSVKASAEIATLEQLPTIAWEKIGVVLWLAQLPEGNAARLVQAFVDRGGEVIFFPPKSPNTTTFAGLRWNGWKDERNELSVQSWRGDEDLLSHTQSGGALPVGKLTVRRYCTLTGDSTVLASLAGEVPLLVRSSTSKGGVYFCTTTAAPSDSSLSSNGVVLYVLIHRAAALGSETLRKTQRLVAGELLGNNPSSWQRMAGAEDALPQEYGHHSGVFSAGDKVVVVNRPPEEDKSNVLEDSQVAALFAGLDFSRVDDAAGNFQSLIQEIWRVFMGAMMIALVLEAALCLPRKNRVTALGTTAGSGPGATTEGAAA